MIHTVGNTGERETLSIFFIGNVKNQNYLYRNSKTRHSCATSAYVFLAPVASVQSESFCISHSGAKILTRGGEREGVHAVELCCRRPPPTAPTHPPFNCQCATFLPHPSPSSLGGTFQATAIFRDKNELHQDWLKLAKNDRLQ